jgi:glucosylceramidase
MAAKLQNIIIALFAICLYGCSSSNDVTTSNSGETGEGSTFVNTDVYCWLTSTVQNVYLKRQNIALNFNNQTNSYPTITVDDSKTYQSMDGFGFALTGGSAYLINRLPTILRDSILHELFDTKGNHIGISYLRVSLGASDLSSYVYSYDDVATSATDTLLTNFSIHPESFDLIPLLKSIVAIQPNIKILASPWSAPAWMKTNKSAIGGSLEKKYFGVYADYLVKYIQAMQEQGITINALTPQNEPLNPSNNPSMYMSAEDQTEFIRDHLGPRFAKNNITTKIICYDHNCDVTSYPLTVLADAGAYKYVDGSAFHLYSGSITALSAVHNKYPDKNVYFTEQWVGGPSNFAEDLKWHISNLIIGASRNWSKNILEWNLASDPDYKPHTSGGCTTCLGGLTIDSGVKRNVSYYVIAHASKFVPDGSFRIDSNLDDNLQNVAFRTPSGNIVVIVLNNALDTRKFNIEYKGKIVTASLPAGAVATYYW